MKSIAVDSSQGRYIIDIGCGAINTIGSVISAIHTNSRIIVITDHIIKDLYYDRIYHLLVKEGYDISIITIEPGEASKSITVLTDIYNQLVALGASRSSLIIALGGGVVGDIAGFTASTFLRGVPYVQIPTTLLAQVDSSVGGKVAVNLESGKNLVGSFYQPKAVLIDPELLSTLPERQLRNGMSEVIKCAAIRDEALFKLIEEKGDISSLWPYLEEIIYSCCSIKAAIVKNDEKDFGERMLLNFGHTLGHSIESYFEYEVYLHGEAVAIGMSQITKISERLGITKEGTYKRLTALLSSYKLPTKLPSMELGKLYSKILHDKKFSEKQARLILLKNIGSSFIAEVPFKDLADFYKD